MSLRCENCKLLHGQGCTMLCCATAWCAHAHASSSGSSQIHAAAHTFLARCGVVAAQSNQRKLVPGSLARLRAVAKALSCSPVHSATPRCIPLMKHASSLHSIPSYCCCSTLARLPACYAGRALLLKVAELVPRHPGRVNGRPKAVAAAVAAQQAAAAGSSGAGSSKQAAAAQGGKKRNSKRK